MTTAPFLSNILYFQLYTNFYLKPIALFFFYLSNMHFIISNAFLSQNSPTHFLYLSDILIIITYIHTCIAS